MEMMISEPRQCTVWGAERSVFSFISSPEINHMYNVGIFRGSVPQSTDVQIRTSDAGHNQIFAFHAHRHHGTMNRHSSPCDAARPRYPAFHSGLLPASKWDFAGPHPRLPGSQVSGYQFQRRSRWCIAVFRAGPAWLPQETGSLVRSTRLCLLRSHFTYL